MSAFEKGAAANAEAAQDLQSFIEVGGLMLIKPRSYISSTALWLSFA
jgi:hypothetical protein